MGIVATALAAISTVADAIAVSDFLSKQMTARGDNAVALLRKCFNLAVHRNRREIALTTGNEKAGVNVDDAALSLVLGTIEAQAILDTVTPDGHPIVKQLAERFRDCVRLSQPCTNSEALAKVMEMVTNHALIDFFSKLPLNPEAFAIVQSTQVYATAVHQQETTEALKLILHRLEEIQQFHEQASAYLDPTKIQQESSRAEYRNPFRIVKAEDFDHDYPRLAVLFREPAKYDNIRDPDNLILEGGRGCGKSMILRSMAVQAAIRIEEIRRGANTSLTFATSNLDYFGVYIKLARGYFYEWSSDCTLTEDAATQLSQHVLNMILLKSLIEMLQEVSESNVLPIARQAEESISGEVAELLGTPQCNHFGNLKSAIRQELRHVQQYLGHRRLGSRSAEYEGHHTSIHDFLDECCKIVKKSIPELRSVRIYFLLDEYENLAEFQQTIINTLAKLRPLTLSLKIATRCLGVKSLTDLNAEPIQRPRDYQVVPLDYDIRDKEYMQLLQDIGAKRLVAEGCKSGDLATLFPSAPPYHPWNRATIEAGVNELLAARGIRREGLSEKQWNEFMHQYDEAVVFRNSAACSIKQPRTYAGVSDFVSLSSGIISTFLELCKMAFYLADGEGIRVRDGDPIPFEIQNRAAYLCSKASIDWIARNIEETGPRISQIVQDLGGIFRQKLLTHNTEPEAARISINNPDQLKEPAHQELNLLLDDGVRWSIFHDAGPSGAYSPKHKTDVRPKELLLNRILCPNLRISTRPRWPTSFTVAELHRLLESATRKKTLSRIVREIGGSEPSKDITRDLPFDTPPSEGLE